MYIELTLSPRSFFYKTIALNDKGVRDCESALAVDNLFNAKNPWASYVVNAVKAKELFVKNKAYLVHNK